LQKLWQAELKEEREEEERDRWFN
jgi:hypothetical protein